MARKDNIIDNKRNAEYAKPSGQHKLMPHQKSLSNKKRAYYNKFKSPPSFSKNSNILPNKGFSTKSLLVVIIIMCLFATITLGGVLIVNKKIISWKSNINKEITLIIKPIEGADINKQINEAFNVLKDFRGIKSSFIITESEGRKMLEPWLGESAFVKELPIPRLIKIILDDNTPLNFKELNLKLNDRVIGSSIDDHSKWRGQLEDGALIVNEIASLILLLVTITTIAIIVFAIRASVANNREIVIVLHMLGASDNFVAQQFVIQFAKIGLYAGIVGYFLGSATFIFIDNALSYIETPGGIEAYNLIFKSHSIDYYFYIWFLIIPISSTLISSLTAQISVIKNLKTLY